MGNSPRSSAASLKAGVRRRRVVVLVHLQTFDDVVFRKAKLVKLGQYVGVDMAGTGLLGPYRLETHLCGLFRNLRLDQSRGHFSSDPVGSVFQT